MKKVLFIMDDVNYKGGAHVSTFNQISFLLSTGKYEISIASESIPAENLIKRFSGRVEFIHLKAHDNSQDYMLFCESIKKIISSSQYFWRQKLRKFKMSAYSRILGPLNAYRRFCIDEKFVLSLIKRFDVVCVPFENSSYRHVVAKADCKRKIQWIHIDYITWRSTNSYTKSCSKKDGELYKNYDQIVFVSDTARKGFVMLYPHLSNKCAVCYNIIDTEKILEKGWEKAPQLTPCKDDALRIITVSRLYEYQKGIKRCLNVAHKLKKEGYQFEWLFIGDGEDRDMLHKYADSLQLNDFVFWGGHQDNPYPFVKQADVSALFSYYEGAPYTILESLILGVPVITIDRPGSREQIPPGMAWLVSNDEQSIYEGLVHLLNNREEIELVKKNLRNYKYDNVSIKNELDTIFSSEKPYVNAVNIAKIDINYEKY
jgi:glycosyltransferase involved in cell wall biosynthesis